MFIDMNEAGKFLKNCDNVYIFVHQSPDGDCIGTGFALHDILKNMGKRSAVLCSDEFPKRFDFITNTENNADFTPETFITVDIADKKLMGKYEEVYGDKINLCIDHHISNKDYAEYTLLEADASSACQVLYELTHTMGIEISDYSASCIYTGIATDTGCFKFQNTGAETHAIVSEIMRKHNLNYSKINREMFDVKSKKRLEMEVSVIKNMEYYLDGKLTIICMTDDMMKKNNILADDLEGLTAISLQVENVEVGITIKGGTNNEYKISMRSANDVNVSEICKTFGGGGHIKASGCKIKGTLDEVKERLIEAVKKGLEI